MEEMSTSKAPSSAVKRLRTIQETDRRQIESKIALPQPSCPQLPCVRGRGSSDASRKKSAAIPDGHRDTLAGEKVATSSSNS
eukprot:747549-Hanusia_phi.AAC.1